MLAFNGTNGMYPTALVQAPDDPDGTTYYGGSHGDGNAYRLSPGGKFTNIVSCTLQSCLYPIRLVIGADGNVYGISEGDKQGFGNNGQLFAITPKFHTEVNFNATVANRPWNLELGHDGSLYGLTQDFYTYRSHFFRFTACDPEVPRLLPLPRKRRVRPTDTRTRRQLLRHADGRHPSSRMGVSTDAHRGLPPRGDVRREGRCRARRARPRR